MISIHFRNITSDLIYYYNCNILDIGDKKKFSFLFKLIKIKYIKEFPKKEILLQYENKFMHNKFYCIQLNQFFFHQEWKQNFEKKKSPSKFHRTNHPSEV